ncbi:MAG: carboxypeptidase regulatory-like domain-containing protein [Candidatus Margulisbacteria bacterium]|nr:carboxypeptidase regulatory-like domain-containing protein [Candidatus Margulisiibacteriota bacterium]
MKSRLLLLLILSLSCFLMLGCENIIQPILNEETPVESIEIGTITGTVVDSNGTAETLIPIRLYNLENTTLDSVNMIVAPLQTVNTTETGLFTFNNLAPGVYLVAAENLDTLRVLSGPIQIELGETKTIQQLVIDVLGQVIGTVNLPQTNDESGVTVSLSPGLGRGAGTASPVVPKQ